MNVVNKVKNFGQKLLDHSNKLIISGAILAGNGTLVYADELKDKALDIVEKIIQPILIAVGVLMVIAGGVKLVLAYRNDQPEQQSGAARDIIIGIAFTLAGTLIVGPLKTIIG